MYGLIFMLLEIEYWRKGLVKQTELWNIHPVSQEFGVLVKKVRGDNEDIKSGFSFYLK